MVTYVGFLPRKVAILCSLPGWLTDQIFEVVSKDYLVLKKNDSDKAARTLLSTREVT